MSGENPEERRLFVGGLSERITDEDLKKTFSRFGSVKEIAIKRKHGDSGAVEMFAFVNLDCVQFELSRCFSLLNNTKWKGSRIVVQLAKESYMDRLRRERETQQTIPAPVQSIPAPPVMPIVVTKPRIEIKPVKAKETKVKAESVDNAIKNESGESPAIIKPPMVDNSQDESKSGILSRYASKKRALSEIKRLESQQALVKMHQERVQAISASLTNPDKAINKKIKFNDESDDSGSEVVINSEEKSEKSLKGKSLFDESDNEDDKNLGFEDKPQFQGKSGEKLFKLQSSYNNDPRFTLNEKFVSESESEEDNEQVNEAGDLVRESKKNLGILEQVLGHQVSNHDDATGLRSSISKKNLFKDFGFLRYDPNKSDSEKFIVKPNLEEKSSKKKESNEMETQNEELDLTDTTRFYDVSENLSKALETSKSEGGQFKLLAESNDSESEGSKHDMESDDKDTEPFSEPSHKLTKSISVKSGKDMINDKHSLEWGMERYEGVSKLSEDKIEYELKPAEEEKWFFFRENDKRLNSGVKFFFNNGLGGAEMEKRWDERKVNLLRYMASRRKSSLKKQTGSFVFNKNQRKRRRQPQIKRNSNKRKSNN